MVSKKTITTIQLDPKTRDALKRKKRGDETYDAFIKRRFGL